MTTKIIYYAFDETEFDNEQDCVAYEADKQQLFRAVEFYGDDLKLMPIHADSPEDMEVWSNAMYFRVVDPSRTDELFNFLYYYTGIEKPKRNAYCAGDVFYYDTDHDEWVNLTEQIAKLTAIVKKFEEGSHADT